MSLVLLDRCLHRDDHLSIGVLQNEVCLSVIVKPRKLGSPGPLGLLRHKKEAEMEFEVVTLAL
jgi:hypothetical protein